MPESKWTSPVNVLFPFQQLHKPFSVNHFQQKHSLLLSVLGEKGQTILSIFIRLSDTDRLFFLHYVSIYLLISP